MACRKSRGKSAPETLPEGQVYLSLSASAALRLNPDAGRSPFGTVGISIVKSAKVVVGTMSDQGFDSGFILIGNMSLPSGNGRTSAAVSIKGEYAAIRDYPMAIRRAIQKASHLEF